MNFVNFHRLMQAIDMLPYLQQCSLAGSDQPSGPEEARGHRVLHSHRVLEVLGRMMATPPNPESKVKRNPETQTDTCFPSLATICRDTCLSDSTVREALGNLIA